MTETTSITARNDYVVHKVLVIPTRSNWHFMQASSPLLRNQHLWPSEFKTDHFRMFGLKVSFAALRHLTCLKNLFQCVIIDLWHLLCTPIRQACMHAFCAHRLACLLACRVCQHL